MYSNDSIGFDHLCYPTLVDIPQKSCSNRLSCVKTSLHQISADILSIDDNLDCCEYISFSVLFMLIQPQGFFSFTQDRQTCSSFRV